jgi:hypothetical protein
MSIIYMPNNLLEKNLKIFKNNISYMYMYVNQKWLHFGPPCRKFTVEHISHPG